MKKLLFILPALLLASCNSTSNSNSSNNPGTPPVPVVPTAQIAAGNHYSLWIKGGAVYGAGEDLYGQLGQGKAGESSNAQSLKVTGLPVVARVFASSGGSHNVALDGEGVAYGWGWNNLGQVGTGSKGDNVYTPVKLSVPALESVAMGTGHTLALTKMGEVYVWGRNNLGQLGTGNTDDKLTPTLLGLTGVKAIASGINHGVALTKAGEVYTWGRNNYGQIGNGERKTAADGVVLSPYKVSLPAKAVAIAAGNYNTFAILETGALYAWGDNTLGLLGDGTTEPKVQPTLISAVTGAKQLDSGARHTLALLQDGRVLAWGDNVDGQLGNGKSGASTGSLTPLEVSLSEKATELSVGTNHNLIRLASGKVVGFGSNGAGRLSQPVATTLVTTPQEVK